MEQVPEASPAQSVRPLPLWLWLGVPIAAVALQVGAKALGESVYRGWMRGEFGLVENLTVVCLAVATVTAFRLWRQRARVASRWFGPFALLMAAGCFFFAGEEASWGQHWIGFEPPEAIAARNDQGEFNVHNDPVLEKLLDQLPRNVLTAAALAGGIVAPIVLRRRRRPDFRSPGIAGWVWPTAACMPAALLAVTVTLPEKVFERLGREVPYLIEISPGETKELLLALFLMIYLLTLNGHLRAARPGAVGDSTQFA